VGVVAGFWNVWVYFQVCRSATPLCAAQQAAPTGGEGTIVFALAVILVLDSLATFVGPAVLFYASAALSLIIDAIEVLNYSSISQGEFYVTLILVALSLGLSVVAARRTTGVSEQSHPMNLPVFG
jgi:hypothetical protein